MRRLVVLGTVVTPREVLPGHHVLVEDDRIAALGPGTPDVADAEVIDASGSLIAPGLIDLHVHGAAGHDTMDATPEAFDGMGRVFASHGVTSYLATTVSAPLESLHETIAAARDYRAPEDGALQLGLHLEGPYLNPDHRGAHRSADLRVPDPADYHKLIDEGVVRMITLAPELPGAGELIRYARSCGVEVALGHSGAGFEAVREAADDGLRHASHLFNGMAPLHHRDPGAAGAVLTDERVYAHVIADGIHVHPAMVQMAILAKGIERTVLISDAMRAADLEDGGYRLGEVDVVVRDGVARTAEGGLAGSTTTLDRAVRTVVERCETSPSEALRMATEVPAEAIGLGGRKGVIAPGADADLVVLDERLEVVATVVAGRVAYRRADYEGRPE